MNIQIISAQALALAVCLLIHLTSWAQYATKDRCGSPYLQVISEQPSRDRIPLKETGATVNITGVIANVKVHQVYVNEGEGAIEAIYVFPASTQAAVHGLTMTIGERRIEARIQEKDKARAQYEQAKQDGRTASLLEQHRPNVFQMNVANIMPGDSLVVELRYTELLVPQEGMYSFVYPTVVGPRYNGETGTEVAAISGGWTSNPYQAEGEAPLYAFTMSGTLKTGIPIQRASCTTHNLDIAFKGKDAASFTLRAGEEQSGDRDLIFNYQLRGNDVESGILLYEGKDENFFLAMIEPPKRVTPDMIPPREYLFVVDVSGSMNGFPIELSKELMRNLLGTLRPEDRFNVLLFASGNFKLSPDALPATKDNIDKGIRLVEQQRGGGGTQLLPALQEALATKNAEGYARTVVIATDGYITVDREAIDHIHKHLGEANFFTFGIGSSVNRYLLEGMAKAGKGEAFVLTSAQEAKEGAKRFQDYIAAPVLTGIKVQLDGLMAYDVEPAHVPDVFAERPIIIQGKYKGSAYGKLQITGTTGAGAYRKEMDITPALASKDNEALRHLWARKRIELLDDLAQFGRTDESKKEVTELGLRYNLMTQYTSFLAEDSEVRNRGGQQTTIVQPLPLPKGVSDMAVGHNIGGQAYGGIYQQPSVAELTLSEPARMASHLADAERKMTREEDREAQAKAKQSTVLTTAEVMPTYTGGEAAMRHYITAKLNLTPAEMEAVRVGKLRATFVIGADGSVSEVNVLGTADKALKERIRNMFLAMKGWTAGRTAGKAVAVRMEVKL
jgi:Ca-activated chloride channel family protein